jgi:hypothetical protein
MTISAYAKRKISTRVLKKKKLCNAMVFHLFFCGDIVFCESENFGYNFMKKEKFQFEEQQIISFCDSSFTNHTEKLRATEINDCKFFLNFSILRQNFLLPSTKL